ncbi:MAG: hypothetical protein P794_00005, partial [Epsilonproteobacteria bacterium (ex Lamellibrachia satsuma)]
MKNLNLIFKLLLFPFFFVKHLSLRESKSIHFDLEEMGQKNSYHKLLFISFLILNLGFTSSYADSGGNGSCSSAEIIGEMNNISTSTSHDENGAVNNNGNNYYKFTINAAGTLDIDVSTRNPDNRNYTFYVANGSCGTWNVYNGSTPSLTHTVHNINISSGDTIYLRVHANHHKSKYKIALDFTATSNISPTADAGPDQTVTQGSSVTLDGSGSSDTDGSISSYSWSDGTNTWTGVSPTISTSGWTIGSHTITLTVTDNDGAT